MANCLPELSPERAFKLLAILAAPLGLLNLAGILVQRWYRPAEPPMSERIPPAIAAIFLYTLSSGGNMAFLWMMSGIWALVPSPVGTSGSDWLRFLGVPGFILDFYDGSKAVGVAPGDRWASAMHVTAVVYGVSAVVAALLSAPGWLAAIRRKNAGGDLFDWPQKEINSEKEPTKDNDTDEKDDAETSNSPEPLKTRSMTDPRLVAAPFAYTSLALYLISICIAPTPITWRLRSVVATMALTAFIWELTGIFIAGIDWMLVMQEVGNMSAVHTAVMGLGSFARAALLLRLIGLALLSSSIAITRDTPL